MEANPVRIIQYFDGSKQSVIPLFQRPYTWEKSHWSVLWEDIVANYDVEGATHFMGAVVSFPVKMVPVGVTKHLVIDGQQRLTTLAILLAALKCVVDPRAQGRIDDYLTNRHEVGPDRLKLLPTNKDRAVYQHLVFEGTPPAGESKIKDAFYFFVQKLKSAYDGQLLDRDPNHLLQVIEHSLQVVMINLGDADDPYLIFESLNAKGESLTEADLVRNYVLMKFPHALNGSSEQERIYELYWRPLEDLIGEKLLPVFLRHYCMRYGKEVDKRAVYKAIKELLSRSADAEKLECELKDMTRLGNFYARFIGSHEEADPGAARSLAAFVELDVTTCYPLLLRLFDSRERGTISDHAFKRCLLLIESFVVRRAVCGVPTNSLSNLFVQWSGDYREESVADWLASKMSAGVKNTRWPNDDAFRSAFKSESQYERSKATKYILSSLERSFGHKEPVDLKTATIEHIMPQTLSPEWMQMLGVEDDKAPALLHTFGNLTLTGYNSELGNEPFAKKREMLKDSHIELNSWIVEQPEWNRAAIEARSSILSERGILLWPGPESTA